MKESILDKWVELKLVNEFSLGTDKFDYLAYWIEIHQNSQLGDQDVFVFFVVDDGDFEPVLENFV